jgi:hypothetical protein
VDGSIRSPRSKINVFSTSRGLVDAHLISSFILSVICTNFLPVSTYSRETCVYMRIPGQYLHILASIISLICTLTVPTVFKCERPHQGLRSGGGYEEGDS